MKTNITQKPMHRTRGQIWCIKRNSLARL